MNRKALQFFLLVAFVFIMAVASQAETLSTAARGNSQEVQQTIKNIQLEIDAARVKLIKAREGADLYAKTIGCKSIPAIEKQMGILSKLVRSGASNSQTEKLATAWRKFENLKISAKANQRGVSLARLSEFEQSIKAMGGGGPNPVGVPVGR